MISMQNVKKCADLYEIYYSKKQTNQTENKGLLVKSNLIVKRKLSLVKNLIKIF